MVKKKLNRVAILKEVIVKKFLFRLFFSGLMGMMMTRISAGPFKDSASPISIVILLWITTTFAYITLRDMLENLEAKKKESES